MALMGGMNPLHIEGYRTHLDAWTVSRAGAQHRCSAYVGNATDSGAGSQAKGALTDDNREG